MIGHSVSLGSRELPSATARLEALVAERTHALENSERRYRTLLNNIPGSCYRCRGEPPYHVEFVSDAFEDITGYAPDALIDGRVITSLGLILPEDRARVERVIAAALVAGHPFEAEYRIRHKDGSIRWVQEHGQGIYGDDGRLLHIDGVVVDVTEHHRLTEQLAQAQHRLTDAIESINEGFVLYDAEDRLALYNENARSYYADREDWADFFAIGQTYEELCRRMARRGLVPQAEGRIEHWLAEQLQRRRQPEAIEERQLGNGRWYLVSQRRTETGGIVSITTDITERKRMELELRGALDGLRAATDQLAAQERQSMLGRVAATVSHELRNPLAAIRNSMSVVRKLSQGGDPTVDRAFARIDRNIERCAKIIFDLLDFTQQQDLHLAATAIDAWLEDVVAACPLPAEVELVRELSGGVRLAVDRDRLGKAVCHLLGNAVQAVTQPGWAPPSGQPRRVILRTATGDGQLLLSVIDNGPGIGADVAEKIFEPLFTTKSFGVGLGLPTVRQIVEQHRGAVEFGGTPGHGAAFTIRLPLADRAAMNGERVTPSPAG